MGLQGELNTAKSDVHKLQCERSEENVALNEKISEVLEKQHETKETMTSLSQEVENIKDLLQSPLPKRDLLDVELGRKYKGVGQVTLSLTGTYQDYDDNQMSILKFIETIRKNDDDDTVQSFSV